MQEGKQATNIHLIKFKIMVPNTSIFRTENVFL